VKESEGGEGGGVGWARGRQGGKTIKWERERERENMNEKRERERARSLPASFLRSASKSQTRCDSYFIFWSWWWSCDRLTREMLHPSLLTTSSSWGSRGVSDHMIHLSSVCLQRGLLPVRCAWKTSSGRPAGVTHTNMNIIIVIIIILKL